MTRNFFLEFMFNIDDPLIITKPIRCLIVSVTYIHTMLTDTINRDVTCGLLINDECDN